MVSITTADREELAQLMSEALTNTGGYFVDCAQITSDSSLHGLGIAIQFAGELILGAMTCVSREIFYASMALHRQLIEVEHLLRYFAVDLSAAERWVTATDQAFQSAKNEFRPAALRHALKLSGKNYSDHCTLGGHPRPSGRIFLLSSDTWDKPILVHSRITNQTIEADMKDIILCDGLLHAHDSFHATAQVVKAANQIASTAEYLAPAWVSIEGWANSDPLARIAPIGSSRKHSDSAEATQVPE